MEVKYKEGEETMSLSDVPTGEKVRLVDVMAGRGLKMRLAAMGLLPGIEITMAQNGGAGPVVIYVRNGKMILGRGAARKVKVKIF